MQRVLSRESRPFRPALFPDCFDVSPAVSKLMQLCWHDDETNRPSFSVIKSYMRKSINGGMYVV